MDFLTIFLTWVIESRLESEGLSLNRARVSARVRVYIRVRVVKMH